MEFSIWIIHFIISLSLAQRLCLTLMITLTWLFLVQSKCKKNANGYNFTWWQCSNFPHNLMVNNDFWYLRLCLKPVSLGKGKTYVGNLIIRKVFGSVESLPHWFLHLGSKKFSLASNQFKIRTQSFSIEIGQRNIQEFDPSVK